MRVIGLAGWSGAGKTTLLVRLIPELTRRGLAVSTLKHAHHAFEIDRPGKDSFEHRAAGAREVLVASARRWALVHEMREEDEPSLAVLLGQLAPVDLVVVEGYKAYAHPKIEVFRAVNGKPLLFGQAPNIRAIASDTPLPDIPVPVIDLDQTGAITEWILQAAQPLNQVLAELNETPAPERLSLDRLRGSA